MPSLEWRRGEKDAKTFSKGSESHSLFLASQVSGADLARVKHEWPLQFDAIKKHLIDLFTREIYLEKMRTLYAIGKAIRIMCTSRPSIKSARAIGPRAWMAERGTTTRFITKYKAMP
jgi:hypothetical protein